MAPVVVILPAALASLFPDSERRVEVTAATVDEMMDALDRRWPGMRDRLCDSRPAIRRHINIFIDGRAGDARDRARAGLGSPCPHRHQRRLSTNRIGWAMP